MRTLCHQHLRPSNKLLNVGCGNSALSHAMSADGFANITNIDVSKVVIDSMLKASTIEDGMSWLVMDARNMEFDDESFDAIVDKGCLDTLLAYEASESSAAALCSQIARILKPGGVYMCYSIGPPSLRLPILENQDYSWKVKVEFVPKPIISDVRVKFDPINNPESCHYVYVCKTGGEFEEG